MSNSPDALPCVSVVVINFNGADTLVPTIGSVLALQGIQLAGVMVLDNNSTDSSVALVRREFPQVPVRSLPENRGPNPARNLGLHLAATDLVLIMDNDIVLAPDYVRRLAEMFQLDPQTAAVSGQIRLYGSEEIQYNGIDIHYAGEIVVRPHSERGTVRVACVSAGAALFQRQKVAAAGGFDEDFIFGWEDGDLTFRLSLAGYSCYMVSAAVAYHLQRKRGLKWVRYQTRNRWWFILKNYDGRTILLALPAILLLQACAAVFCLVKGRFLDFAAGTMQAWSGWPRIRRKRRMIRALKKVPDVRLLRGDRFDLPGDLSGRRWGRVLNAGLSRLLRGYWFLIRPLLRHNGF